MRIPILSLLALALFVTGCVTARPGSGTSGLVGPTWHLTAVGGDAPTGPEASITFDADGRVFGTTGCNRFTGTYELASDGALMLGPLGTTRMACEPGAMAQERSVLDALDRVARTDVQGDRLHLLSESGARLLMFDVRSATASSTLTGTITYRPRIALPPEAVITVRLLDVSRADAPSETLAEQAIPTEGRNVPVPFELAYDGSNIDGPHRYVVRADIRDRTGALLWTTNTTYPALTGGAPSSGVEVRLVQVTDAEVGATVGALIGLIWRVHQIDSASGVALTLDWRAPYTLRFEPDGRYSGQLDCNHLSGTFDADENGSLELANGLSTLAACPPGSASGDVLRILNEVERYTVIGDRLELRGEAGMLVLVRDDISDANTGALPGPEWQLTQIQSATAASPQPQGEGGFTITFLTDGRFVGRADCNRYGGAFEADSNGGLILTNPSTTIAACAPPSSSHAFFGILNQVIGFGVSNGSLTLRGADGGALIFERNSEGWMSSQETGKDHAYTCESPEGPFTFRTRTGPGEIALWLPERFEGRDGGTYRVLGQVRSASGAKYQDGPVTLWTKGGEAYLEVDGDTYTGCRI